MTPDIEWRNAAVIQGETDWFAAILERRMKEFAGQTAAEDALVVQPPPLIAKDAGPYARALIDLELRPEEWLVLITACLPVVSPSSLDPFLMLNSATNRRFSAFGGVVDEQRSGFSPTVQTALFLVAGASLAHRLRARALFEPSSRLYSLGLLSGSQALSETGVFDARLELGPNTLRTLTPEAGHPPIVSPKIARRVAAAALDWSDMVLDPAVRDALNDIRGWVAHERELLGEWGLSDRVKPGFRALFHGPPGAGKTMAARALGESTGLAAYRVDVLAITLMNLSEIDHVLLGLFDAASRHQFLLVVNDVEGLLGRSASSDVADHGSNHRLAYFMRRIEAYPGLVIVTSNLDGRVDEAFAKRFQAAILFPTPSVTDRLKLWQNAFLNKPYRPGSDVDVQHLAKTYELTGGAINNVLRYACLKAAARGAREIINTDLVAASRRESA